MVATAIPSSFFLPLESVRLGRFINIHQPHEGYHEPLAAEAPKAIVGDFAFSSQDQDSKNTRFGAALTSLISAGLTRSWKSDVHIAPARGINYSLDNSDAWFDKAVSTEDTRRWIERAAIRHDKIYMIVGIQTLIDARIFRTVVEEGQAGGKVNIPVSLFLATATATLPLAELVDPTVYGEHQSTGSGCLWLIAPGEQVCSLQYREVKPRWLDSRRVKEPRLSKTRRWLCMEGETRREVSEDEEDEKENQDMIGVDFEDVNELVGEWDTVDTETGAIYLES